MAQPKTCIEIECGSEPDSDSELFDKAPPMAPAAAGGARLPAPPPVPVDYIECESGESSSSSSSTSCDEDLGLIMTEMFISPKTAKNIPQIAEDLVAALNSGKLVSVLADIASSLRTIAEALKKTAHHH